MRLMHTSDWHLGRSLHGDLGRSVMTSHPVTADIAQFFPATLELATTAMVIAMIVGIPLGVIAAARQGSRFDHVVRVVSLAGQSVPVDAASSSGVAARAAVRPTTSSPGSRCRHQAA